MSRLFALRVPRFADDQALHGNDGTRNESISDLRTHGSSPWLSKEDDPRRFLHPETIARISRLDLRARHVVEGFISGMHRSPFFGHSVEFVQHREYIPGDDIRHLDWKVWSKTDRFYIKQYEEETNLRCTLVVDVSESMHYGRGALNKYNYACTIAACLGYLLLRQQDAVGLHHLRRRRAPSGAGPQPADAHRRARQGDGRRAGRGQRPISKRSSGGWPRRSAAVA